MDQELSQKSVNSSRSQNTTQHQQILDKAVNASRCIRGSWLLPHRTERRLTTRQDAILLFDEEGIILELFTPQQWKSTWPDQALPPVLRPGCWWTAGLIDTHVHYPQTQIIGSASGPLLDWLATSVFPEEARFAQDHYAKRVASYFCESMLKKGTTSAAIFSSSHVNATDLLFKTLAHYGMGAELGLTLMDRGAPDNVLCPADEALAGCERLIDQWHGQEKGRLKFCVTPRFGLSCTPKLLQGAGELAHRHQLLMQTHISENSAELIATAEAFPNSKDYLGVYEDFGLINERSLLAHCIWLSDSEWDRVAQANVAVSHCPDSNFFLGSGSMSLAKAQDRGVRVGLGSDVGAGRSFSMLRACARAYDASRITESTTTPSELLWLANRGGALALHRDELGIIEAGAHADLICLEPPPQFHIGSHGETPSDTRQEYTEGELDALIARFIFSDDWDPIREVYTRGVCRWSEDEGLS